MTSGGNSPAAAMVCVRVEWQKDIGDETDVDESTASTRMARRRRRLLAVSCRKCLCRSSKSCQLTARRGHIRRGVEILWNGDDATEYLSSRPTHARGRVLTGDAQTCTVDDPREISFFLSGHVMVAFVRFSFVQAHSDLRLIHATASMAQVKTTVRVSPIIFVLGKTCVGITMSQLHTDQTPTELPNVQSVGQKKVPLHFWIRQVFQKSGGEKQWNASVTCETNKTM